MLLEKKEGLEHGKVVEAAEAVGEVRPGAKEGLTLRVGLKG